MCDRRSEAPCLIRSVLSVPNTSTSGIFSLQTASNMESSIISISQQMTWSLIFYQAFTRKEVPPIQEDNHELTRLNSPWSYECVGIWLLECQYLVFQLVILISWSSSSSLASEYGWIFDMTSLIITLVIHNHVPCFVYDYELYTVDFYDQYIVDVCDQCLTYTFS